MVIPVIYIVEHFGNDCVFTFGRFEMQWIDVNAKLFWGWLPTWKYPFDHYDDLNRRRDLATVHTNLSKPRFYVVLLIPMIRSKIPDWHKGSCWGEQEITSRLQARQSKNGLPVRYKIPNEWVSNTFRMGKYLRLSVNS